MKWAALKISLILYCFYDAWHGCFCLFLQFLIFLQIWQSDVTLENSVGKVFSLYLVMKVFCVFSSLLQHSLGRLRNQPLPYNVKARMTSNLVCNHWNPSAFQRLLIHCYYHESETAVSTQGISAWFQPCCTLPTLLGHSHVTGCLQDSCSEPTCAYWTQQSGIIYVFPQDVRALNWICLFLDLIQALIHPLLSKESVWEVSQKKERAQYNVFKTSKRWDPCLFKSENVEWNHLFIHLRRQSSCHYLRNV